MAVESVCPDHAKRRFQHPGAGMSMMEEPGPPETVRVTSWPGVKAGNVLCFAREI